MAKAKVAVILGSDSDLSGMEPCFAALEELGIGFDVKVLSAHRSPAALHQFVKLATRRGYNLIIAAAGGAAHLAGVVASLTNLPVIAVPMYTRTFEGIDSFLSTLQMPSGVPVATMPVGQAGAANAAILAAQILAIKDPALKRKLVRHKRKLAEKVADKDHKVKQHLSRRAKK